MKRTFLCRIGLAVFSAVALGSSVTPAIGEPQRPGAVVGRVVDADNNVVAGARVGLVIGAGEVVKWTETNERGEYAFKPIRPGQYAVGASKPDVGRGHTPRFAVRPGEVQRAPVRIGE